MKIISHRGNLIGPNDVRENTISYICEAIDAGYDVEIDVWYLDGDFYLGHDIPEHKIPFSFLQKKELWCHAKNIQALIKMLDLNIHCFWHETDKITLTSKNIPWCYPKNYIETGITVVKDKELPTQKIFGICTDYPLFFKKKLDFSIDYVTL
jgi:hypothetical protein